MKWVLLSVAVFLGSIVVFVAIPRPALLWIANSVGVFGGGLVQVADPTRSLQGAVRDGRDSVSQRVARDRGDSVPQSVARDRGDSVPQRVARDGADSAPQRAARDGGDSVDTRTAGTFQADLAGRARVIDGDTIEVASARIRLFGVDAPESAQRCLAGSSRWSCGAQATRALAGRIDGRSVACEERDRDRYGRIVAVCRYSGQNLNAWLVREGWAMAYRRYSTAYVGEEASARRAKRGLWRGDFVPPWDWRRGDRLNEPSRGVRVRATSDAPRVAARDRGGCNIKGNISHNSGKRIYHVPGDRDYERTRISASRGEKYFCTEVDARAAGWRRAGR